jgi:hypothetical protein
LDRLTNISEFFEIYQHADVLFARELGACSIAMVAHTAQNVIGHADVERAARLAG